MTAATMISMSSAMPIAVMIESSENTRSMTMICMMTQKNALGLRLGLRSPWRASTSAWISCVALAIRKAPPPIRMMSRQDSATFFTVMTGSVSPISQTSTLSSNDAEHQRQRQADLPRALGLLAAGCARRSPK